MTMENLSSILQKCSIFKNKSLIEIENLLSHVRYHIVSFKENEIIFSGNQIADTMGIILSGAVDVQKLFPSGKIVTLNRRTSLDLIADAAIFSRTKYYPATISTCRPCDILFIHKDELLKLFLVDRNVLLNFLESVSNRTLALNQKIEVLSLNYIQERIAYFLMEQYEQSSSNVIKLPFPKKTLAEHLNVSRPSLSRELKQLEARGIISFNKQYIRIRDVEGLRKILC